MERIARVNMAEKEIRYEEVPRDLYLMGGRALVSTVVAREVDPMCHPLGRRNKVVIAPSLLAGTGASSTDRLSIGVKSPLTQGIKESNAGGTVGRTMSLLGLKAVVVEECPGEDGCFVIYLGEEGGKVERADAARGLLNYELADWLHLKYGPDVSILCVGPAGENRILNSTVACTDAEGRPARHAARGGPGAVLGAKGVKALVFAEPRRKRVELARPKEFMQLARGMAARLRQEKAGLKKYGSAQMVRIVNSLGGLPTRNFRSGCFEEADAISGERLAEILPARGGRMGHPCAPGCAIACSNIYYGPDGKYVTAGLEYESIAMLGANLGIADIDAIASIERLCDDLGIDTIETGATLGVLMDSGWLKFGDVDAVLSLLMELRRGSLMGRLVGAGVTTVANVLGLARVPAARGQSFAAYDPRAFKGTGATYATSPMGADHTAGCGLPGRGGLDVAKPEGQATLSFELQVVMAAIDSCACLYVGPTETNLKELAALIACRYGEAFSLDDILALGKKALQAELTFNEAAGLGGAKSDLPEFVREEVLPPKNLVFDVPRADLKDVWQDLSRKIELLF